MGDWQKYRVRYQEGEWRAPIFCDMILEDIATFSTPSIILDIGCGSGFDDDLKLQKKIVEAAGQYIGIDPDANEKSDFIRTLFEDAAITSESIDLAFAVMVLEHISDPNRFWSKLHSVLRPGGIFWGFTMDSRHWFRYASTCSEKLQLKNAYMDILRGKRGVDRYANYPTWYRSNSPAQIEQFAQQFRELEFINFQKIGQLNYYLPGMCRPIGRILDRIEMILGGPGTILAVRAVK